MARVLPFLALLASVTAQQRPLLKTSQDEPLSIAVIGAGVAAASLTSRLAAYKAVDALNITVFDREAHVGGRIKSAIPDAEWGYYALELGADRWYYGDECLGSMGGRDEVFNEVFAEEAPARTETKATHHAYCNLENADWKELSLLVLKYGTGILKLRSAIVAAKNGWKGFLPPNSGEIDLDEALAQAGFTSAQLQSADGWFSDTFGESSTLEKVFIQPCTQSRVHQTHLETNALNALLAQRESSSGYWSYDGNVAVVDNALKYARAKRHLKTEVLKIEQGKHLPYSVSWREIGSDEVQSGEFEIVVIAAPFDLTGLHLDQGIPGLDLSQIPRTQYQERDVTYFTSPLNLRQGIRDIFDDEVVRDGVITAFDPQSNITSISTNVVCYESCRPGDERCGEYSCENMYKIVSRHPGMEVDIKDMLDHDSHGRKDYYGRIPPGGVTWSLKSTWQEGLATWNLQVPQTDQLAPGLFYTSGLEHVVSTMEMSCRMGRHVADKILLTEV